MGRFLWSQGNASRLKPDIKSASKFTTSGSSSVNKEKINILLLRLSRIHEDEVILIACSLKKEVFAMRKKRNVKQIEKTF